MTDRDYIMEDAPNLPDGWVWTTLGEICTSPQYGYTASATNVNVGPKFLRITDISKQGVNWNSVPYCDPVPENWQKYRLAHEDILIARSGATVGKAYRVVMPPDAIFASYLIRFRSLGVSTRYIEYFLQSKSYWEQITDSSVGNTIPNVNASKMKELIIPLAPLAEQHRIVEAIEAQFSRIDEGVTLLRRIRANLRRYKAAVLKAACEGRLVPQDPADEPASELLDRILQERRAQWEASGRRGKYVEPQPPDMSDLPELPEGWVWASFDQILAELKNGYFGGRPSNDPPGTPILRIGAVRPMSVDLSSIKYIPDDSERLQDYELQEGDLLFTRYNGNIHFVGVCGMVRNLNQVMLYPDKLIRAKLVSNEVQKEYIEIYFATQLPRNIIENETVSTAGQNGISGPVLKRIPVALPPTKQQKLIVESVAESLSIVEEIETAVEASLKRAERLRQSILKQAFAGQLVPQDPSDEPASALLGRIQQEKKRHAQ